MFLWKRAYMARIAAALAVGLFGFSGFSGGVAGKELTRRQIESIESDAIRSLDKITALWEAEEYDELYRRGMAASQSKITAEGFAATMGNGKRRPKCCWERFQGATARLESPERVAVTAKIGYDYQGNTVHPGPGAPILPEFDEETFSIVLEDGTWRVDLNQILDRAWIPGRKR